MSDADLMTEARELLKRHCVKGYITTIDAVSALVEVMKCRDHNAAVLLEIDGEACPNEPPAAPTVGHGDEIIAEAFQEGLVRGLWLAANIARTSFPKVTCTSTHCERRQECCSPSECTGSIKGVRQTANATIELKAALIEAKREMWIGARVHWTMADFKNWAVIQQIDAALEKADG